MQLVPALNTHNEAIEDAHRSRLVVGPARSCSSKRLLSYHSAGTFIVEVEVSSRISQLVRGQNQRRAVIREYSSGQTVRRSGIYELARLFKLVVRVHVDCHDGSKDLFGHGNGFWIFGDDDGGFDEVAFRVVPYDTLSASNVLDTLNDLKSSRQKTKTHIFLPR